MCEPISLGAIFASIGSAFKFADFAVRIAEVGSENEVFVRTIRVVRDDLNEVERLLKVEFVHRKLANIPGKLAWVTSAVLNTKSALNEIGRWVERARSEQESTGTVQFETRIKWAFNNHDKLLNRKTELMTCHQQLSNVLSYLIRLEDVPVASETQNYSDDTSLVHDVLSRHSRKMAWSNTHANLQHSNTTLSPATAGSSHDALQHRKPSLSSSSFGGNPSGHINPSSTLSFAIWPTTPPCSPPPTYNSVVESNKHIEEQLPNLGAPVVLENQAQRTSGDFKSKRVNSYGYSRDKKQQHSWAYEYAHKDVLPPEMPGDTVIMSGTNSMGPVNPFDFSPEVISQRSLTMTKHDEAGALGELLGDLTFPVELPASNAGPAPTHLSSSGSNPPLGMTYASHHPSHRMSLPELPVVPRRRPVMTHANTHLGNTQHVVALTNPRRLLDPGLSGNTTSSSSLGTSNHLFELPSSSYQPPISRFSYPAHGYHNQTPPNMASHSGAISSLKNIPTYTTPPGSHITTHKLHDAQTTTQLGNTSVRETPLQLPDPASSTRMRRQKDMMNLLGALGT